MRTQIRTIGVATYAAALLAACTAEIGASHGTNTNSTGQPVCFDPSRPHAPALHARLLSVSQYNNTVQDIFKAGASPASAFAGYGSDSQLDDLAAEQRATAAATIAHQAAASLAMWSPCAPPAVPAATCEQQLIEQIGMRAYRHPLSAAEKTELQALFDAGAKESGGFATGVEWFLTGLLQTPDFLYQFAKPSPGEQPGQLRPITDYEMASQLSYFVWDTTPDDKLYAAAAANQLSDPANVQTQLDRMLQDQTHFVRGVTSFYNAWLMIDNFNELARDAIGDRNDVVHSLGTSLLMSATQLYTNAAPNIGDLFSGQTYYFNDVLCTFYGLTGSGTNFGAIEMKTEDRNGLLTHPALLALLARPKKTHPIARGLFVRSQLLCQQLAPPPGLTFPPLPETPVEGVTTREEVENHVSVQFCASCHADIDPPGFALENFDEVGRHRTTENGVTVDTSGQMNDSGDLDGPFASGAELLQRISTSATVKSCFAHQYFEHALSRTLVTDDGCSLDRVSGSFSASGDLKALVVSIVNSDSFRFRTSEGTL